MWCSCRAEGCWSTLCCLQGAWKLRKSFQVRLCVFFVWTMLQTTTHICHIKCLTQNSGKVIRHAWWKAPLKGKARDVMADVRSSTIQILCRCTWGNFVGVCTLFEYFVWLLFLMFEHKYQYFLHLCVAKKWLLCLNETNSAQSSLLLLLPKVELCLYLQTWIIFQGDCVKVLESLVSSVQIITSQLFSKLWINVFLVSLMARKMFHFYISDLHLSTFLLLLE